MEYGCAVCLKYFDADYNQLVECPICELKVHQSKQAFALIPWRLFRVT